MIGYKIDWMIKHTLQTNSSATTRMILLAEDEPALHEAENAYLRQAGYIILETDSNAESLTLYEKHTIELAVLNINIRA